MDLGNLNPEQQSAVKNIKGPVLILAGAGSGKTRVLTHRIAYLMSECHVPPWRILALTFTNKAAREMKTRMADMVGEEGRDMWCMTFHAMCLRILRREATHIGLSNDFSIYDEDDSIKTIQRVLAKLEMSDKFFTPRDVRSKISSAKNAGYTPDSYRRIEAKGDFHKEQIADAFAEYERQKHAQGAVDFDDLIGRTLELFQKNPEVLASYAGRFMYIHVDEYQDTNHAQYELVHLLASHHRNLCVVGDDDQSIYSWRGADISNILDFEKDFPDAFVVRLEQNYRSTTPILTAANAVIERNTARKEKALWTAEKGGEKVRLFTAHDEHAEAEFVASEIRRLRDTAGWKIADFAVLYRTHAQSRVLENALLYASLPYRVYGGLKFFDRAEVRDVLAYLRVLRNPLDDAAFRRIVNFPRRGLGDVAVDQIAEAAAAKGESLMNFCLTAEPGDLKTSVYAKLMPFVDVMRNLMIDSDGEPEPFVTTVMHDTGLWAHYTADQSDEGQGRVENLKELLGAVKEYQMKNPEPTLGEFLDQVALVSEIDGMEEEPSTVTMMTLHSAKGLEFPVVFLVGLEEGVFPHSRSLDDFDQMEEERRLCYVGMTRAMRLLYLCKARRRMLYNNYSSNDPARFLNDVPGHVLTQIGGRPAAQAMQARNQPARRPVFSPPPAEQPSGVLDSRVEGTLAVGANVEHAHFGKGVVKSVAGQGPMQVAEVDFGAKGVKRILTAMAPMRIAEG